ncbi:MAG: tRNA 2-thiouridine(34) synthase MnmA [Dehalococcoidaceae bacterium]|nr:tRNA 2-thiouridine(34) synthase MnmA [Dehalococcoidaceae bacterium]
MTGKKVAVAISGGVDSAVAAAILKEQGYNVLGITMHLFASGPFSDIDRAHVVTASLGIPHYVVDLREPFARLVIDTFCGQYETGKTPNPCILCNRDIKFGLLFEHVMSLGADYMATGHYARIDTTSRRRRLLKGVDPGKDQSYFLYTLKSRLLARCMFPVGSMTKQQVIEMSDSFALPVEKNTESSDVCFLSGANYRRFLEGRISSKPGMIIDSQNRQIGIHAGLEAYTIGQRHGLELSAPHRLYVTGIDAARNCISVGSEQELYCDSLIVEQVSWIAGCLPKTLSGITARIRYRSREIPVSLQPEGDLIRVYFKKPAKSVTPGQSIVFYQGDRVLGGGIIRAGLK